MRTNQTGFFILAAIVAAVLLDSVVAPASPDGKPRENLISRAVVAVKVWLFDHRHLFKDEAAPTPADRRYTTDEWHATYANRKPQREIGPDGYLVLKHGEGL